MYKIYKYRISSIENVNIIPLPKDALILYADRDNKDGYWYMWVQFKIENETNLVERKFSLIPTGAPFGDVSMYYISTIQTGPFVYHLFEYSK